jgi:hypothetical protein
MPVEKVYTKVKMVERIARTTMPLPSGSACIRWKAPVNKSHLPTNPLVGGSAESVMAAAIHKMVVMGICVQVRPFF